MAVHFFFNPMFSIIAMPPILMLQVGVNVCISSSLCDLMLSINHDCVFTMNKCLSVSSPSIQYSYLHLGILYFFLLIRKFGRNPRGAFYFFLGANPCLGWPMHKLHINHLPSIVLHMHCPWWNRKHLLKR